MEQTPALGQTETAEFNLLARNSSANGLCRGSGSRNKQQLLVAGGIWPGTSPAWDIRTVEEWNGTSIGVQEVKLLQ